MALEKRKAFGHEAPAKRIKFDDDGKSRTVSAKVGKSAPNKSVPTQDRKLEAQKRSVKSSLLSTEDRAFPRGGASVLTPLEQRQIRADAERDVLFEEAGKNAVIRDEYAQDGDAAPQAGAPKKKRKPKTQRSTATDTETEQIKVQGLGFHTIAVGSLVLGQVVAITSKDIALALPNNLTGYVPITAISDVVNQRIQALLDDDKHMEDGSDNGDDVDDDDVDLSKLFRLGQYLRASVTATSSDASGKPSTKSKRRIELSVEPRLVNQNVISDVMEENCTLQAMVVSVEDHGAVVDLGFDDKSRGFISKKELGQQWNINQLQPGQVMLCCVTGFASGKKVIKLSPDHLRIGELPKHVLKNAPTVAAFLPGTAVEILVTSATRGCVAGKIQGLLDATADSIQSGAGTTPEAYAKIKPGQKVLGRILFTFADSEVKKVGVSLLDHVRKFEETPKALKKRRHNDSDIIESTKVTKVIPGVGLFLDVGHSGQHGFAHISKLSDAKVDALFEETGPFALGSQHRARVISFNPIDGVYNLTLEESVLNRKYLRINDVEVGSVVDGTVERLILGATGVTGVLIDIGDGIVGLAPQMHLADVQLSHPEKRFREGVKVKARVLSVNPERRQIRLTLKKTLVNVDTSVWKNFKDIKMGDESAGTIIKLQSNGAAVQFYGAVRAWLPVAEMSEAYIADASQHFRLGQTVIVRAKEVDAAEGSMIVSCRAAVAIDADKQAAWTTISPGQIVSVRVLEVSNDILSLEETTHGLRGSLQIAHLTDGSEEKSQKLARQLRVGQTLSEVLVLDKRKDSQSLIFSNKSSLIEQAKKQNFILAFSDANVGGEAHGFVRNIIPDGIFVEFGASVVGFLPKHHIPKDNLALPAFGYRKGASLSSKVLTVDSSQQRFVLSMRKDGAADTPFVTSDSTSPDLKLLNAVDGVTTSIQEFVLGKRTAARITSVKDTQLNVQLADNVSGRIDVSEAFDSWNDMHDRKRPLSKFKPKQIIQVMVLGIHDARNHRFLPITHRRSKDVVFELSAKVSTKLNRDSDLLTLAQLEVGSNWIAFVNNIAESCLWVNITPNVRGRVDYMSLTDNAALLQDVEKNFPVGSALQVTVKRIDLEHKHLDLIASAVTDSAIRDISDVSAGTILPVKIIQVTERFVRVALSEKVTGIIGLTDMEDDYNDVSTAKYNKGQIVRAAVVEVDTPNKRLFLSVRPSKVLSSSLDVTDRVIDSLGQLKPSDVVRGFVKVVRPNGVVVSLGRRVEAFVRVSDLSDAFIKDWQSEFQIDQLVKGKIVAVDAAINHIQMSLKASHVDKDYVPPRKLEDFSEGDVVTGKIRKVEDFGVFIDVDSTLPRVSGLCHRSQIADRKVKDIKALYDEGDIVKTKILSIDLAKRKISFGLKASLFKGAEDDDTDEMDLDPRSKEQIASDEDDNDSSHGGIDLAAVLDASDLDMDDVSEDDSTAIPATGGLQTTGFDWDVDFGASANKEDSGVEVNLPRRSAVQRSDALLVDQTGELDANGPQSTADFERLLLSSPHDSSLWVAYMAFHLRLSEVNAARDIGYRALQTIPLRETDEKMQVWIALLNLEIAYSASAPSSDDRAPSTADAADAAVERVFRQACAVQDPYTMHTHLAEIYMAAGQPGKADKLYESMLSSTNAASIDGPASTGGVPHVATDKLRKEFRSMPQLWLAYASFLFARTARDGPARARALLPRALQSVPEREKRDLTVRFARLEFGPRNGSDSATGGGDPERGRTVFEGIVGEWPRWAAGWDGWVDGEMTLLGRLLTRAKGEVAEDGEEGLAAKGKSKKRDSKTSAKTAASGDDAEARSQVERIDALYERMMKGRVKTRRAKFVFKKWKEFQEKYGDSRGVERVVALAKEWVEKARQDQDADEED